MENSYFDRINKLRRQAQESIAAELPNAKALIGASASAGAALMSKTATVAAAGCSSAMEKAKQTLDHEGIQLIGDQLKAAAESGRQLISDSGKKAQSLMIRSDVGAPAEDESERTAIKQAMDKMSGKDKVGIAGEHLAVAGGSLAGASVAGSIAAAAGATTLFGSSTLAGLFGGIFVTATPVGWVIGSAVAMGAAGYGIAKLIRSGSEQDRVRKEFIERQAQRLLSLEAADTSAAEKAELSQLVALTVAAGALEPTSARRMVDLVDAGRLPPRLALERIKALALSQGLIEMKT